MLWRLGLIKSHVSSLIITWWFPENGYQKHNIFSGEGLQASFSFTVQLSRRSIWLCFSRAFLPTDCLTLLMSPSKELRRQLETEQQSTLVWQMVYCHFVWAVACWAQVGSEDRKHSYSTAIHYTKWSKRGKMRQSCFGTCLLGSLCDCKNQQWIPLLPHLVSMYSVSVRKTTVLLQVATLLVVYLKIIK